MALKINQPPWSQPINTLFRNPSFQINSSLTAFRTGAFLARNCFLNRFSSPLKHFLEIRTLFQSQQHFFNCNISDFRVFNHFLKVHGFVSVKLTTFLDFKN